MNSAAKTKKVLTMRDVMTPSPHAVGGNQTVSFARRVMMDNRLRHLPVLQSGKLIGVVSLRDLQFLARVDAPDVAIENVLDSTKTEVYTTHPTTRARDVIQMMAEQKHDCAVVMDRSHVVGIFTVTDALKRLAAELG